MAPKAEPSHRPHPPLGREQAEASRHDAHVWLSASAGSGKTLVLSARVLRLLLNGVAPESILCLTFTKAGASEMANRINASLAGWVMADDHQLFNDLEALGEKPGPEERQYARTLFARLLDARGGGLRIQTIHSFCQSLLSGFPVEAGLAPGFRLIEDRDVKALLRQVFADMMAEADDDMQARVAALGVALGKDKAMSFLAACGTRADAMAHLPKGDGMRLFVHRALSGGTSDIWDLVRDLLDGPLPHDLPNLIEALEEWDTATGRDNAAIARLLLHAEPAERLGVFEEAELGWLTKARTPRSFGKKGPALEAAGCAIRLHAWSEPIFGMIRLAEQADWQAEALLVGAAFATRFRDAKAAAGLVDFGDLINRTAALLGTPGMGAWVRFKLDQATDHILIDEAQDTNEEQWDIIKALSDEYFAGAGAVEGRARTIFTVGDYKQAIFGFQGTDPENFREARDHFAEKAAAVDQELQTLSLSQSFRTSPPILQLTDAVIETLGHQAFGLEAEVDAHRSADAEWTGSVTLIPPIEAEDESEGPDEDSGEEDWIGESERKLAARLARQIHHWWKVEPLRIARHNRPFQPGDAMILLRKRGELARLIVARLHAQGIPVAGLDVLRLGAPLAVQDLLSCARFAMQPGDDLNLAGLLVSPLIGLSQDALYSVSYGRTGALWPHLEDSLRTRLMPILDAADMTSPYRFFETILSGPMQGRERILARMGEEARDPINALLSAALDYEASHPPSLQLFLDWFDKGDSSIKRDAESSGNAVRVMTVHGAKGLQAPVVILADAAGDPKGREPDTMLLPKDVARGRHATIPLLRPTKAARTQSLALIDDARAESEMKEHRRLLYVALTRAEERLVIAGALKKKALKPESWHASVDLAMTQMGAKLVSDPVWEADVLHLGDGDIPATVGEDAQDERTPLPDWLRALPPEEARPARPLSPSSLGPDDAVHPPASAALQAAAERGRLLHALFERLPDTAPDRRRAVADHWLSNAGRVSDPAQRAELTDTVLSVMDHDLLARYFAPGALVEAPLAGVVDGFVVAGTVDRLIVSEAEVLVIDFKTGRFAPRMIEQAPVSHLRQMAAYARLLGSIFPEKRIRAALLYTNGPRFHELTQAMLTAHKPDLTWAQQDYPG